MTVERPDSTRSSIAKTPRNVPFSFAASEEENFLGPVREQIVPPCNFVNEAAHLDRRQTKTLPGTYEGPYHMEETALCQQPGTRPLRAGEEETRRCFS